MSKIEHIKFDSLKEQLKDYLREDVNGAALFYKARNDRNGFDFYVYEFVSGIDGEIKFDNECEVDNICNGTAYFDGIRHIYFGDEGYINYPSMKSISNILNRLRGLEHSFCNESQL